VKSNLFVSDRDLPLLVHAAHDEGRLDPAGQQLRWRWRSGHHGEGQQLLHAFKGIPYLSHAVHVRQVVQEVFFDGCDLVKIERGRRRQSIAIEQPSAQLHVQDHFYTV
jgi:hypothetical protein